MTLTETAYLTIDDGTSEAVFELRINLEETSEINKTFVMADRGQYIQEVYEQLPFTADTDGRGRRRGYYIDGGAGEWNRTVSFGTGIGDDVQWGDGSADDARDASGTGVHPVTRRDVIEDWIGRTTTGSLGQARFYYGEWTDGRFEGDAGAFNQPMFVAIIESNLESPDLREDVNTFEGSITLSRVSLFPESVPTDLEGAIDFVTESLDGLVDR